MSFRSRAHWNPGPPPDGVPEIASPISGWRRTTPLHRMAGASGEGHDR